ncbi:male-enhanced antigen 1-like [Pollicipes pollicipes]|uniref:male-enhanced antigen 1-like n=1 Tax=Pollicipes pollicipes TaxID=41117 RepID=UPI0018851A4F|nr:male-enhanced antigen 1-like [Pollicipes pollicipes]
MPPEPPRPPSTEETSPTESPPPPPDGYQLLGGQTPWQPLPAGTDGTLPQPDGVSSELRSQSPPEGTDGTLPQPDGVSSEDESSEDDEALSDRADNEYQPAGELTAAPWEHDVNGSEVNVTTAERTSRSGPTADRDVGRAASPADDRPAWPLEATEAELERQKEAVGERQRLFGSAARTPAALLLPPQQAEAVRRAMRAVRLPAEATPDWARGLSDQQWQQHVDRLLGRRVQPPPPPGKPGPAGTPHPPGSEQPLSPGSEQPLSPDSEQPLSPGSEQPLSTDRGQPL